MCWNVPRELVIQRLLGLFEIGVALAGVRGLLISHMISTSLALKARRRSMYARSAVQVTVDS